MLGVTHRDSKHYEQDEVSCTRSRPGQKEEKGPDVLGGGGHRCKKGTPGPTGPIQSKLWRHFAYTRLASAVLTVTSTWNSDWRCRRSRGQASHRQRHSSSKSPAEATAAARTAEASELLFVAICHELQCPLVVLAAVSSFCLSLPLLCFESCFS